jgi:hypothetical protein
VKKNKNKNILVFRDENYSKFNIFSIWGLKVTTLRPKNFEYNCPKFELVTQLVFPSKSTFSILIEISMRKTTQNSISCTP